MSFKAPELAANTFLIFSSLLTFFFVGLYFGLKLKKGELGHKALCLCYGGRSSNFRLRQGQARFVSNRMRNKQGFASRDIFLGNAKAKILDEKIINGIKTKLQILFLYTVYIFFFSTVTLSNSDASGSRFFFLFFSGVHIAQCK